MKVERDAEIHVKNLRLRTYIGINEDEIKNKQDIIVNLWIQFDGRQAFHSTDIDNTVNYRTITKSVINHIEQGRFALLESLTHDVLELVMSHKEVDQATVEIDKPHALRFADSVSIKVTGNRD